MRQGRPEVARDRRAEGPVLMKTETLAVHGGYEVEPTTKAVAVPIYQTASYAFDSADHGAALFNLEVDGFRYTRIGNPTNAVLEKRVAALEGGIEALSVACGQAATHYAVINIAEMGTNVVSVPQLYGTTHTLFAYILPRQGITVRFAEDDRPASIERLIDDDTRAVFCESVGNPAGNVCDIEALAEVAHSHGVPLIVDNTVPTPILLRPIDYGADIVVESLTKFMGGHGTTLGGIIVDSGKFPWNNGKFKQFTDPSPAYHGMRFWDTFGNISFIIRTRVEGLRDLGPCVSPFNSFLFLQGIETLGMRMDRHLENSLKVAQHLEKHPKVSWIKYASLPGNPYHALAQKYTPKGAGAVFSFGLKDGFEAGKRFINKLKIFSHLANVGDSRSLVIHPASTTHQQLGLAEQEAAGVTPELVRLSVGLEDVQDLIWDIDQALE